jgi:hypothetical protein
MITAKAMTADQDTLKAYLIQMFSDRFWPMNNQMMPTAALITQKTQVFLWTIESPSLGMLVLT